MKNKQLRPAWLPESLLGLDAKYLANLYDFAWKFGIERRGFRAVNVAEISKVIGRHLEIEASQSITIAVPKNGKKNIAVIKDDDISASYKIALKGEEELTIMLWDKAVSLAAVSAVVVMVDQFLLWNFITEQGRLPVSYTCHGPRISVDRFFTGPERHIVIPADQKASAEIFDKPRSIIVHRSDFGDARLIHRKYREYYAHWDQVARRELMRHGYTNPILLAMMSESARRQLRQMVDLAFRREVTA